MSKGVLSKNRMQSYYEKGTSPTARLPQWIIYSLGLCCSLWQREHLPVEKNGLCETPSQRLQHPLQQYDDKIHWIKSQAEGLAGVILT